MRKADCFLETVGNGIETVNEKRKKQLYSQNEIAEILGISKGALSKWLKKSSVSPKQLSGQRKLYEETVIDLYRETKKKKNSSIKLTKVELLQKQLEEKQREIDTLRQEVKDKDKQLTEQSKTIVEFANKFATLADQAQKLNLADKKDVKNLDDPDNGHKTTETVSETAKETPKKQSWFKRIWGK
ncbi:helix-turn-helix domain-containing protein [Lactobacillus taiwanensis]|uniref:helix-turn-helix domain-containing protein n=1 Tax=Lactobacillus taiwanensis TaxID=508451 RepID=UPI0025B271B8|nr:helix-turn-helix domain-containing protein [Lactobacillus taiwanensis]